MLAHAKPCLLAALIVGAFCAGPARPEGVAQVAQIVIPDKPVNQIGVMAIDQSTSLGYLADKDSSAVVVFDTKSDAFVKRIPGFVGLKKDGNASGPNGVVVVGAELWVSDGDSTIKVVDLKSDRIVATIPTGGKLRANAMAYDRDDGVVIVANSNEAPPYLSLISTQPDHRIIARIAVPESAENIERSVYHAPSKMFYTVIPVFVRDAAKGILAQTDVRAGKLVKLHELDDCHPHSLQAVSDTTIFLGCSSAHGPTSKPGGDLAVFDIASGKIMARGAGLGGNGGSDFDPHLSRYYHATSSATLIAVDTGTQKLVEKIPTSNGARSVAVSAANNKVYVATAAKDGPCGGCIMVYAQR